MSTTLPGLPEWPLGQPLPPKGITILYDPGTGKEYRIDLTRLGGTSAGEDTNYHRGIYTARADGAQALTSAELPDLDDAVVILSVGVRGLDAQGNPILEPLPSDTYTFGAGRLTVQASADVDKDDVLEIAWLTAGDLTAAGIRTAGELLDLLEQGDGILLTPTPGGKLRISSTVPAAIPTAAEPVVTGFLPNSGPVGATITIAGAGFTKATSVLFNGTAASFQVINATTIVAVVPVDATTGQLAVANSAGIGKSTANFEVKAAVAPPTPGDTVAPSVSFTVPAAGATLTPGTQVLLTAIANDNVAVAGLTFTNGATGQVLGQGSKNGSTYTLPYTVGAAGALSLVATATDAAGNSQSATVNVTVGSTAPAPTPSPDLTAALAISVASLTLGAPVSFTITPGGGTSPYAYEVVATDTDTGQTVVLGTNRTGNWTPTVAGYYSIDASVTDSSVPSKRAQAITRYLRVSQAINRIPVADAGADAILPAGTTSVALMGKATDPDTGDTIEGHAWRQITGPNNVIGLPAATQNIVASGLVAGTYQFGYIATDNHGGQSVEDYVMLTVQAATNPGDKGELTLILRGHQSNDNGLSDLSLLQAKYRANLLRRLGFDITRNAIETFNVGTEDGNGNLVGANNHAITRLIVPSYPNGVGPSASSSWKFLQNNLGNSRTILEYVKDLTPPVSTNSSTTMIWLNDYVSNGQQFTALIKSFKTEITALFVKIRAMGYSSVKTIYFNGLGEGNGDAIAAGTSTQDVYYNEQITLVNEVINHVQAQGGSGLVVHPVKVGFVIKRQPRYASTVVPIQYKLVTYFPTAKAVFVPGFDEINGWQEGPGGTHLSTPNMEILGEHEADMENEGFTLAPTITSFYPASQVVGGTVAITGTNFKQNNFSVSFGGVTAAAQIVSDTQYSVIVPANPGGTVNVTTVNGSASKSGFTVASTDPTVITAPATFYHNDPLINYFQRPSGEKWVEVSDPNALSGGSVHLSNNSAQFYYQIDIPAEGARYEAITARNSGLGKTQISMFRTFPSDIDNNIPDFLLRYSQTEPSYSPATLTNPIYVGITGNASSPATSARIPQGRYFVFYVRDGEDPAYVSTEGHRWVRWGN